VQNWHQVDICESEPITDKKAGLFDGCVENRDLPPQAEIDVRA
jgi:hypothetical protein